MKDELILIVDDGNTNRKLYQLLLSKGDFSACAVTSAQEALERLLTIRPSLILIDIQLGGMNGLELTRQIKANPATHDIPIIVMTAHYGDYDEYQARKAGADEFISLPIGIDTFVPFVRQVIVRGNRHILLG